MVSVPPEALKVHVIAEPEPQVVVPTSVESKFKVTVSVALVTVSIPLVPPAISRVSEAFRVSSDPESEESVRANVPPPDEVKQVAQLISPVVAFRTIGVEAETATVPDAFGKLQVLSEAVKSTEVIIPLKVLVAVPD